MKAIDQFKMAVNAVASRSMQAMFPGYGFGDAAAGKNTKHLQMYREYGYPDHLRFADFHEMYKRNPIAAGAINKTINKTWQEDPWLLANIDKVHDENIAEREVREQFERLEFWSKVREADLRSLQGRYSALLIVVADDKDWNQPVEGNGGLERVVRLIPVYQDQISVARRETARNADYGKPLMYTFSENALEEDVKPTESEIHPDRVFIWSADGTMNATPSLESGYNALLDIVKIAGGSAEGFWKNAKNSPFINIDPNADVDDLMEFFGAETQADLETKVNQVIQDWSRGFDKNLMFQGLDAKTLGVTLQDPKSYVETQIMLFSCAYGIPMKILVGNQTGERASTEDANEWAQTITGRRNKQVIPNVLRLVAQLSGVGLFPTQAVGWKVDWADLQEASPVERMELADKMASVNQKNSGRGEVFTPDEIREVTGREPQEGLDDDYDDADPEEEGVDASDPA